MLEFLVHKNCILLLDNVSFVMDVLQSKSLPLWSYFLENIEVGFNDLEWPSSKNDLGIKFWLRHILNLETHKILARISLTQICFTSSPFQKHGPRECLKWASPWQPLNWILAIANVDPNFKRDNHYHHDYPIKLLSNNYQKTSAHIKLTC